jgi:hypothetical protein
MNARFTVWYLPFIRICDGSPGYTANLQLSSQSLSLVVLYPINRC